MPNFIPYLALIVISVAILIGILVHTKRYHTFVAYISFIGMIYVFEVTILVVLNAYEYKPQITPIRYLDSMIGASVSNTFTVPTAALLISVFQLRFRWIVVFSLMYGVIEFLFVHWGVYEHHWWRIPYTIASLLFFFTLTKWWSRRFLGGSRPIRAVTFLVYTIALVYTSIFVLMLTGTRMFTPGIFEERYRDDTFFTNLYGLFEAVMITAAIFWLRNWRWLIAAGALIVVTHYLMIRSDILNLFIPLWLFIACYSVCCCFVIWLCYLARRSVNA